MSAPYLLKYGSEDLKIRYLKPVIAGDMVSAVAITEPGAGSDVKQIKTTAVRDGDFILSMDLKHLLPTVITVISSLQQSKLLLIREQRV
jgi:hypothetical protein